MTEAALVGLIGAFVGLWAGGAMGYRSGLREGFLRGLNAYREASRLAWDKEEP